MAEYTLPDRDSLPEALTARDQWVCWQTQERDGKPTKVPRDPETGAYGSATDESTWSSFSTAREYAATGDADGIGFVFTDDDPLVGIDLDDCRVPGSETTLEWAESIIEQLDSYTEISPSGTGYHVIVRGKLPDGRNRKGDVELYETARFFTVTGDHVPNTPTDVAERNTALEAVHAEHVATEPTNQTDSDQQPTGESSTFSDEVLLERARNAENGDKFQELWDGSTTGYDSHSEADMALCSLLAFWTGGDSVQMDRLFQQSGLMREKWGEVHYSDGSTYGEKTIERAIAGTSEFYDPTHSDKGGAGTAIETPELEVLQAEVDALETREQNRLKTVEALAAKVSELETANDRLRAELETERAKRQSLEAQLTPQNTTSLWQHIKRILSWRS